MNMFWQHLAKWGEKAALNNGNEIITFAQLDRFCDQFASRLPTTKALILIESDNSIDCIIALYGSLKKGHAVLLCELGNTLLKNTLCDRYSPELVYAKTSAGWDLIENQHHAPYPLHQDLALLLNTSGSTGEPKCARIAQQSLEANTNSISTYLNISASDRSLLLLPIFYCYGLSILNTHLSRGACTHIQGPSVESCNFITYLKEQKITSFSGVPYTYELLERTGFRQQALPDMQYLAQAGGKLRRELVVLYDQWARGNGGHFYVMYGQAEAASRIAYMPPELLAENPDCIGNAIPGGELLIIDGNDRTITESGIEGELAYQGPNVMMGYADSREDLGKAREITLLKTGDLALRTENNLFKITGRMKRICKIYGKRYNLDALEQALQEIDSATVCVSNDEVLFIGTKSRQPALLIAQIVNRFGIAAANIVTRHYAEIPVLNSGKRDYLTIAADFTTTLAETKVPDKKPLKKQLIKIFQQVFPELTVNEEESFATLGGDSLSYVEISINIERALGNLPEHWESMTIGQLSKLATTRPKSSIQTIETGIALRAISISAIVLQHNDLSLGGGGVLLMLIAGRNFARFHLDNFIAGHMRPTFLSILKNILLPYWLILIYFNLQYDPESIAPAVGMSKFLLIGNYYYQQDWLPFPTWFIQVLTQVLVCIAVPLSVPPFRKWAGNNIRLYLFALFLAAILYRLVDGLFLIEMYPNRFADQRTAWEVWVFVMGMIVYHLHSAKEKTLASLALVVLTLFFWTDFWSRMIGLSLGGLLLIWKSHITVPLTIVPAVKVIGSASLFIYMAHLIGVVDYLEPFGPVVKTVAGMLQGILLWFIFKQGERSMPIFLAGLKSISVRLLKSR